MHEIVACEICDALFASFWRIAKTIERQNTFAFVNLWEKWQFQNQSVNCFLKMKVFLYNLLFPHSFEQLLVTGYFIIQIKIKWKIIPWQSYCLLFTQNFSQLAPQFSKVFEWDKIGANQLKIEILDKLFQSPNGTIQNMLQELDLIFKHNLYLPS